MGIIRGAFAVLIPGVGKMLRRKYAGGAAIVALWAALVECYAVVRVLNPSGLPLYIEPALLAGIVSIWSANAVLEGLQLERARRNRLSGRIETLYADALTAFASGEDAKADELLRSALHSDELNVDCLFLRAQVALKQGKTGRARRLLRKCRDFDEKGKWRWETQAAWERL